MSLYRRILATCIAVIILTVVLSSLLANWTVQGRLDRLISLSKLTNNSSIVSADYLAHLLSQEVATQDGWTWMEETLYDSGYVTRPDIAAFLGLVPRRSVVLDLDGNVQFDNFTALGIDEELPATGGQRVPITNLQSGQPVGLLYLDPPTNYLEAFSSIVMQRTLLATVAGGLLTAVLAGLIAVWLARRIAEPVATLTNALETVLEEEEATLLPVISTSDEFGKMSAAFNKLSTDLTTQRELRKRLVDDISHELNTPLSIIRLEADGMSRGMQSSEEAAKQIVREVEKLQTLVYDLSWLAETDSGPLALQLESCSIETLLAEAAKRWHPQARSQSTELVLRDMPNLPTVDLDKARISQAFGNILRNALQHTNEGQQITIGATLQASPNAEQPMVVVTVADDGAGIDPAELLHIFERLYRTEASRTRSTSGSGLGLAITRTIIDAHNGNISVTSDGIGRGTTIRIELPVQ